MASNPITGWIDVVDQYGTQASEMSVWLKYSITRFWLAFPGGLTELIVAIGMVPMMLAIWLMGLVQDQSLFVEIIGGVYQSVLDAIYQVISPWIIVMFALPILLFRLFIGEFQRETLKDKTTRMKFALNKSTLSEDEGFRKKVVNELVQVSMLLMVMAFLLANPFKVLGMMFGMLTWFATTATTALSNGAGTVTSTVVDGMLVPVLQMINFGHVLEPDCSQQWSQTISAGGDVLELSCVDGEGEPTFTMVIAALLMIVIAAALIFFSGAAFLKLTFFEGKMVWHMAVLPWQIAWMIASPGVNRQRLDEGVRTFREAIIALLWAAGLILLALLLPGLTTAASYRFVVATGNEAYIVPALLVMAAMYAGAGYAVWKWYGHPVKWSAEKKRPVLVIAENGPMTSWADLYRRKIKPQVEDYRSLRAQYEAEAEAAVTETPAGRVEEKAAVDTVKATTGESGAMNDQERETIEQAMDGRDTSDTSGSRVPTLPVLLRPPSAAALPAGASSAMSFAKTRAAGPSGPAGAPGQSTPAAALGAVVGGDDRVPGVAPLTTAPPLMVFSSREQLQQYLTQQTVVNNSTTVHNDNSVTTIDSSTTSIDSSRKTTVSGPRIVDGTVVGPVSDTAIPESAKSAPMSPIDAAQQYQEQVRALQQDAPEPAFGSPAAAGGPGAEDFSAGVRSNAGISTDGGVRDVARIDSVAAAALTRTQQGFADAVDEPAANPVTGEQVIVSPVASGAPQQAPFMAAESMHNRYVEFKRLADILGVAPEAVVDDSAEAAGRARIVDGPDGPQVRFGNPRGFGDDL
ncbi:hypothetical protein [Gordonia malaquae]|uniref:hypothetical protein n=1 Tax=Gordonia malaquae TaxID=410332 RepID=UPI00301B2065